MPVVRYGFTTAPCSTVTVLLLRPPRWTRLTHRRLPPLQSLLVRGDCRGGRLGRLRSDPPGWSGVSSMKDTWERIHRCIADQRLLATTSSCSRVADCSPNYRCFPPHYGPPFARGTSGGWKARVQGGLPPVVRFTDYLPLAGSPIVRTTVACVRPRAFGTYGLVAHPLPPPTRHRRPGGRRSPWSAQISGRRLGKHTSRDPNQLRTRGLHTDAVRRNGGN